MVSIKRSKGKEEVNVTPLPVMKKIRKEAARLKDIIEKNPTLAKKEVESLYGEMTINKIVLRFHINQLMRFAAGRLTTQLNKNEKIPRELIIEKPRQETLIKMAERYARVVAKANKKILSVSAGVGGVAGTALTVKWPPLIFTLTPFFTTAGGELVGEIVTHGVNGKAEDKFVKKVANSPIEESIARVLFRLGKLKAILEDEMLRFIAINM